MKKVLVTATLAISAATLSLMAQTPTPVAVPQTNIPVRIFNQADMMKKYDKDGDGKLSDPERAAMLEDRKAAFEKQRKAMEKEFDKNGDGVLDEQERTALRAEMQKRRPRPLAAQHFQEQMLKRYDKDGDGKLSPEERKAMQDEQAQRRQKMMAAKAAATAKMASATNAVPAK